MKTTLKNIYESVEKFLSPLALEETYKTIVKELKKMTGSYAGIITLYTDSGWRRVYQSHSSIPKVKTRKRGLTYRAFKLGKPIMFFKKDIVKVHPEFNRMEFIWNVLIPLTYGKKSLGVIILYNKKDKLLKNKTLGLLKIFGSFATLAIRKTQLYKEVKDALDQRELFISMAAHELKTPLTTMNAYVQLFQHKHIKKETINVKWVEQLAKATNRLKKLVFDLLQIEQIKKDSLEYQKEEINLKEVIDQAITDFKFFNPKHKLLFIDDLNNKKDIIYGDFDKLLQAFNNILNNAAKYSKEGTDVTIVLDFEKPNFVIKITDQGEGISKKDLTKIFDKYYKGEQKNKEGLGLGLFLTKRIIEKHQGKIDINSQKKFYTTVRIFLPMLNYVRTT